MSNVNIINKLIRSVYDPTRVSKEERREAEIGFLNIREDTVEVCKKYEDKLEQFSSSTTLGKSAFKQSN